jgi:hypothetical protein
MTGVQMLAKSFGVDMTELQKIVETVKVQGPIVLEKLNARIEAIEKGVQVNQQTLNEILDLMEKQTDGRAGN